jgi:hypothetical protein
VPHRCLNRVLPNERRERRLQARDDISLTGITRNPSQYRIEYLE